MPDPAWEGHRKRVKWSRKTSDKAGIMTPNAEKLVEPGQIWLRKRASAALVRRVRAVENGKVHYEVLHGPASSRRKPLGSCNVRSFVQHAQQIEEQPDYSHLDGAKQFNTFLVLSTQGEPLLRCSQKRADFYLKKGFARSVDGRRVAIHRRKQRKRPWRTFTLGNSASSSWR